MTGSLSEKQRVWQLALDMAPGALSSIQKSANALSICRDKKVGARLYKFTTQFFRVASGNNVPLNSSCVGTCAKEQGNACYALHAEMRALLNLKNVEPAKPLLCISTLEPCVECAKALIYVGVQMVIYAQSTNPEKSGKDLWEAQNPDAAMFWKQVNPC